MRVNITRNLSLRSVLNITKGEEKGGIPLRHAAPLFGSTHLEFKNSWFNGDIYASYNGKRDYEDMPPSEIDKAYMYAKDENGNPWSPGWATLNLKTSFNLVQMLVISAGIENILDLRYRPYSSGIAAPGRNFTASIRIVI